MRYLVSVDLHVKAESIDEVTLFTYKVKFQC